MASSAFPAFESFGLSPKQLTHEEAISASPDERIASVWRFLTKRAVAFYTTLKADERSNFGPEDILLELYVALREKDSRWEPERGRYITYAARIASRAMSDIRDQSRTVESPRNSTCRMCEYQAEANDGSITDKRAKTFNDIKRSAAKHDLVATGEPAEDSLYMHDDSIGTREDQRLTRDAIKWGLMALTPFESLVMGEHGGLWGKTPRTLAEIAERTGKSKDAVKKARDSATSKIRRRLLDMGHPAVASEN